MYPLEGQIEMHRESGRPGQRVSRVGGRSAVPATHHLLWSQNLVILLGILFFPFQPMSSYKKGWLCPVSIEG